MTVAKTLSAIIVSAVLATPAFAQTNTTHHSRVHDLRNFRGVYNQLQTTYPTEGEVNLQNFGFSGRDLSRPGGWDPSLRPAGN